MTELEIVAGLEDLDDIREFVARCATDAGLLPEKVQGLKLAVDEACANVIEHAYGGRGPLTIGCEADADLVVTIIDVGQEFNPMEYPPPDLYVGLEDREIGGLGIHLIRSLVDDVEYSRTAGENRLRLRMVIGHPQEEE